MRTGTQLSSAAAAAACDPVAAGSMNLTTALASGSAMLNCFCATKGYDAIIQSGAFLDACRDWLQTTTLATASTVGSSIMVVLINNLLRTVLIR